MFWKFLIPVLSVIGFGLSIKNQREQTARRLVEDALRFGRTKKEFEGAATIARLYKWGKMARELEERAKKAIE